MTKLYTLLLPLLLFAACKSPGKAFNQGNYNDAIERSVRKLQKDPDDAESKRILQSAYTYAVNQYEEKIRSLSDLHSDNRWEQIYLQYSQLQRLYDKINESPAAVQAAKPVNYASYLATYRDKSAEAHIQKAVALLDANDADKSSYREAYYELRAALKFRPDDDDILKKLEDAREAATVNILLVPIDVHGSYRYNTSYAFRNFEANLVHKIRNGVNNEFLNFMTDSDSRSTRTEPDEVVEMRLGSLSIGRPYDESKTRTITKEVVVKETVYSKDSVIKEYAKVEARITTTKRLVVSNAELYMSIRNPERLMLWNDNVPAEHRWATTFTTYTGDERALSDSDKALLNKTPQRPPNEEDVVDNLLQELAQNVTQRLRSYYNRY
jgi:hypothetical protein